MLTQIFNIRYVESFISAYEVEHQQIFYNAGLRPRGYVPSWSYNEDTKRFEDYIVFNNFQGNLSSNIQLIDEGKKLVNYLGFQI